MCSSAGYFFGLFNQKNQMGDLGRHYLFQHSPSHGSIGGRRKETNMPLMVFGVLQGGISAILPLALTVSLLELWGSQDLPIKYPGHDECTLELLSLLRLVVLFNVSQHVSCGESASCSGTLLQSATNHSTHVNRDAARVNLPSHPP
jgi:hypothetical protein